MELNSICTILSIVFWSILGPVSSNGAGKVISLLNMLLMKQEICVLL